MEGTMKKIVAFSLIVVLAFMMMAKQAKAAVLPENPPVVGVESTTTDFYSHWQPGSFGASRIGDQGVAMALTTGFGLRAGFRTPFNATDFEMQLDLTYMDPGTAAITFFGPQGSYISGNGAVLSIEFVKHTTVANKYLVAIQVGSGTHHISLPEFILAEQGDWEDANWKGYQLVAAEDVITVSIKEVGTNVNVTINGQVFTVASATFYQNFADKTNSYFLVGGLNIDGSIQTLIANYVVDASRRAYYAEDGVYDTFKTNLVALEAALLEDLSVIANVQAAQAINANINLDSLKSYDKNYYQARYDAAQDTLEAAITELGGDIVLDELETAVVNLEGKVNLITNFATANQAIAQLETAQAKELAVDSSEFSPEQLSRLTALSGRIEDADALIISKVHDLVSTQIDAFEASVLDLSDISKVNAALDAKAGVSNNLISLLAEVDQIEFNDAFDAAEAVLLAATQTLEGWIVGDNTYVIENNNKIEATFLGSGLGEGNNGLFYELEALDVRNFKMTLDISAITVEAGGWISFGIMENPEIFSTADDASVQNNKGLFFLIIPDGANQARVEIYMLSLYSNRFFDAKRTATLTIDLSNEIVIDFSTEMKTVSGVTDEYLKLSIGGQVMTGDTITTRSLKTSLANGTGYLYLAATGGTNASKNTLSVSLINGKNPLSESLAVAYAPAPHVLTTTLSYELESLTDKNIEFYNRDLTYTVKVNDVVVDAANYTYANNVLKLKSSFLETLEAGEYEIKIETAGGSASVALSITAAPAAPQSSNRALVLSLSIGGGVILLAAAAFFVFKKKGI